MKPAVLCVALDALLKCSHIDPETPGIYPVNLAKIFANNYHFLNRSVVDASDKSLLNYDIAHAFPQILGYVTIQNEDGKYLSYSRGTNGGEKGLAALRSIGVGGHTDIADVVLDDEGNINAVATLEASITRELSEEIGYFLTPDLSGVQLALAVLNDPVSAVHIGLWVNVVVDTKLIAETDETQDQKWSAPEDLLNEISAYEPWSQMIIKQLNTQK
ncbi:hypothetical protein [Acinetobacter sp. A47]|uniref:hypothetical protein n=1 Tax=Acinetobacter sp. A47 TaxID=1561217 RepID=UPI00068D9651|nr:hypothetical protein [Acinetobacter sp. A47]